MALPLCIICGEQMKRGLTNWHSYCSQCGYEGSLLEPEINSVDKYAAIDEHDREIGLKKLRQSNFAHIINILVKLIGNKREVRVLEIGCAHGWFLEMLPAKWYALGIEPDIVVYETAQSKNIPVRLGYFPAVLDASEYFDVIVFNDVLEHIPDARSALQACGNHLVTGGILALNLPDNGGFFYRLSKLLFTIGMKGPFERMWQYGFPSPHIHYFSNIPLTQLLQDVGFEAVYVSTLPTLTYSGLYSRINHVNDGHHIRNLFLFAAVFLMLPALKFLPGDIYFGCFKKVDAEEDTSLTNQGK